ncbi:hypothetical protein B0H17DRAFT_1218411 [Mycena rosella]|uniref:Uncharacterized protein n=1 Tax=Mycena rosella TaxID=1033263 RepID=A0AAD7FM13_MYCRO|nr:hypothetical protein B0H17DRAFT_1218411 [Mycena rosella]
MSPLAPFTPCRTKNLLPTIEWSGINSRPIIATWGLIISVFAGQPNDTTYLASANAAYAALKMEAATTCFPRSLSQHRHGNTFPAFNVGTFYGKGTRTATLLNNSLHNGMLARLVANHHFNCMAVYANSVFALWAPHIYNHYHERDTKLCHYFPHLPWLFPKSIFLCATFNFGPNIWTFRHCDGHNMPFGWCAVAALGVFDHMRGGHLVLRDLKLVVEFPSLRCKNPPSERALFMQYIASGLLRFVDNQFRTKKEFKSEDPEGYARMCEGKEKQWEMGLGLLSTIDELCEPA